jgi:phage-related protein
MKDITYWNDKLQRTIDKYPPPTRDRINFELVALQNNCTNSFDAFDLDVVEEHDDEIPLKDYPPAQKKSMKETIGEHAMQLTIKGGDSYRVIYVAKFEEAIYVLHSFKKKSEGVMKKEYRTAALRYKELVKHRED